MLRLSPRPPVDYSKCNQTVTIYHKEGDTYTQRVIRRAFFDWNRRQTVGKTGSRTETGFLLVIPCDTPLVFVGDKVLLGKGEIVDTRELWAAMIPATVPGLGVVSYVDEKYWRGNMVHVEAGG